MKILLIEDDIHTSKLISAILVSHHYAVEVISDGTAILDLPNQDYYDLILLDIGLPKLSGIEVCRRLRQQNCQTPILMLTQKDATDDIVAGLDAGADDYLVKSSDSSQLLARVRALLRRGGTPSVAPVLTWGLLCLDPATARVTYDRAEIPLRPREYALLELFLRNPHRILNRSAIIDHLWAMDDPPIEGSVTNLIKDLRQRLKAAGLVTELIETVYGLGYRLKALPREDQPSASPISEGCANQDDQTQRGKAKIQHITKRFHSSLQQRIAALETTEQLLQAGHLSLQQRQATQTEAHKLAGSLGTFGYEAASETARRIEALLEQSVRQEALLMEQLPQLLKQLKQELAQPATDAAIPS